MNKDYKYNYRDLVRLMSPRKLLIFVFTLKPCVQYSDRSEKINLLLAQKLKFRCD